MADKKISALTGATTPLAGNEVLPIVQSGSTVKVSVADLTAGRALTSGKIDVSYADSSYAAGLTVTNTSNTAASQSKVYAVNNAGDYFSFGRNSAALGSQSALFSTGAFPIDVYTNSTLVASFTSAGNLNVSTAAKGVNFTANTPAAGMTSQLLNWYEEGDWTPTVTASSGSYTTVGAVFGNYIRIGRSVTIRYYFIVSNKGTGINSAIVAGLPFTSSVATTGIGANPSNGVAQTAQLGAGATSFTVINYNATDPVVAGQPNIGSITYFV